MQDRIAQKRKNKPDSRMPLYNLYSFIYNITIRLSTSTIFMESETNPAEGSTPSMQFARNLAALRKQKKVSQRTAALALGISQALLSHYENGLREPGLEFLIHASRYYECSVDALLGVQPETAGDNQPNGGRAAEAAAVLHTCVGADQMLSELMDRCLMDAVCCLTAVITGASAGELSAVDAIFKADETAVCAWLEQNGNPLRDAPLPHLLNDAYRKMTERIGEMTHAGWSR